MVREKEREREWEFVPEKRRQKGSFEGNGHGSRVPLTKFFVSNLPDGCRPWDLSESLKRFGELAGVYIARKRSKGGERFGFTSFKNVKDWKEMEEKMKNVKMGRWSLKINKAWFAVENGADTHKGDKNNVNHPAPRFRSLSSMRRWAAVVELVLLGFRFQTWSKAWEVTVGLNLR